MASAKKQKSTSASRQASRDKADRSRQPAPSPKTRKLDDVSDAPESGEPRAQGRSRGRIIESDGTAAGSVSKTGARSQTSGKRKGTASNPRAAAERDESGDTANEAWESGRQKAMGGASE
jgi:hypothetical protein